MTPRSVRSTPSRRRWWGLALALTLGLASLVAPATPARAQGVQPIFPNVNQRSGLLTRYTPEIRSNLPPDPDRDQFYLGRRWGEPSPKHPNLFCNSGLYGLQYKNQCTACYSPYFSGSPGGTTAPGCCEPVRFRVLSNFVHPWRPVGGYYSGGCAVPIYDLDPFVPGPGRFPFPWLYKRQHQGG